MVRFKQFSGSGPELERDINRWLGMYEPDVSQMTQTVTQEGRSIISFLFDESFRGRELRYEEENRLPSTAGPAVPEAEMPPDTIVVPEEPGGRVPTSP